MDKKKRERGGSTSTRVTGILQLTRKGVGYLPWPADEGQEPNEDIEIAPEHLATALNGDQVEVEVRTKNPRPTGRVVKVIARSRTEFVGIIVKQKSAWYLVPDDKRFYQPIRLDPPKDASLKEGFKALVSLREWKEGTEPMGDIIEVLGEKDVHRVEMNAIVLEHGFRTRFPDEAAREAKDIEKNHGEIIRAEIPNRLDFRNTVTFTIDPHDAKDFDDALSVKDQGDGTWEIGVHIADVTHFVRPGMELEEEAKRRGTSIYLVDSTIPMLPEELSGNVCSLREGEDRLTFGAIFTMNMQGEVLKRHFARTIINSNKRFTYQAAQKVLDDKAGEYFKELSILSAIGDRLKEARVKQGAIEFEQDEIKFELDQDGKPLRVIRKKRIPTMMMIEEWMLLANREVTSFVHDLLKKVPERDRLFVYRIHDMPKADRIEELSVFLKAAGYEFAQDKKKPLHARDFNALFKKIEGTPEESLIKTATIRSMAKAIYSTKNIGHFGLSFRYYTHFTSPIRRYPDMMVHRLLAGHLEGNPIGAEEFKEYERLVLSSSESEARAAGAERESIKYKQVEYMREKIGSTFEAIISGVTDWGIYVEEPETRAEGLIRVRNLPGDYYTLDRKRYALVGSRTGKKFALGDQVKVKLLSADLDMRQLDFELVK